MSKTRGTSEHDARSDLSVALEKPFLRGWLHAIAAVAAVIFTLLLCLRSRTDLPRLFSLLLYGLSMIELYTVSAIYHIGTWSQRSRSFLRTLDHANIFLFIAGTYTPLCFNLLSGWVRPTLLIVIWSIALLGMCLGILILQTPRWLMAGFYVVMGWVALMALPAFLVVMPWTAVVWLLVGGMLYTIGALIYARRWPDLFPRLFGFHELFHLFVLAGGVAFAMVVWIWAI